MQKPTIIYAINDDELDECSFIKTSVLLSYSMPIILFILKQKCRSQNDFSVKKCTSKRPFSKMIILKTQPCFKSSISKTAVLKMADPQRLFQIDRSRNGCCS